MPALAARSALSVITNLLNTPMSMSDSVERRASPRRQAALTAEVMSGGRSYQAQVQNISTGGLTLAFPVMPVLFKGAQLLVRAPGFAPITGAVRWFAGNECGLAFNVALAEDMLEDELALYDPGKRPRPGRARIKLPAAARAPGVERKVMIENIGSGGAQISSGLPLPLTVGLGVMIEIDGLMPIGSYVRWCKQGRCGVMFTKLLSIAAAEDIADRCSIHPSWLAEIRTTHAALADSKD